MAATVGGNGGLTTGTKKITFTGYDFAGNKGSTERTNVTLDVDNLTVTGLFPSNADEAGGPDLTVIEDMGTADVRFALDEEADSLVIRYPPRRRQRVEQREEAHREGRRSHRRGR